MSEKFDIVISVGVKDVFIVQKTVKYIRRNITADIIYLIMDRKNYCFFSNAFLKDYQVVLLDENSLCPDLTFTNVRKVIDEHLEIKSYGWYYQQFLKIGFCLSMYAKEVYLIWDADTIPLNKLSFKSGEHYICTAKTEYHKPYFDTLKNLLGLKRQVDFSFIAEHMIIDVSVMRKLVDTIQNSSVKGSVWFEKIINSIDKDARNGFSEFETYGNFSKQKYPDLYIVNQLRTLREGGLLYGRGVTNKELDHLADQYDTVSFEQRDYPPFPRNIYQFLQKIFFYLLLKLRKV